jgi:hypothetical protein
MDKKNSDWFIFFLVGLFFLGLSIGVLMHSGDTIESSIVILTQDIEYKSIDIQEAEYYIVDNEGNIYEVTQEQWYDLDVPVLTNTGN